MPKFRSHRQFCKYLHDFIYGQEEKRQTAKRFILMISWVSKFKYDTFSEFFNVIFN